MNLLRHAVNRPVIDVILSVAPVQRLPVQVGNVAEHPVNEEVLFYKADETLNFAFCKRMPRLAELRFKAHRFHKSLIILLPDRATFQVSVQDDALHVVCQDKSRNAHVLKGMDHANKEVLLSGVGKELNIPLAAVVADHGKAGHAERTSVVIQNIREAPVYLERLAGSGHVPASPVSL